VEHEAKLQEERIKLIMAQSQLEQIEDNARIEFVVCSMTEPSSSND
jgi:hypothetical protein